MAETATYGWMIAYGGRGLVCSTRCSVCVKGSLCARGRIALGFLACAASNEASSRSNMHGIPITPQRWQPSESPASFSQRLFCFLHALHALEDLGRFGLAKAFCDASSPMFVETFSPSMKAVRQKIYPGAYDSESPSDWTLKDPPDALRIPRILREVATSSPKPMTFLGAYKINVSD